MDQDLDFEIGNGNSIYRGCAAMLMGQMMYFGGHYDRRQVRIVFGRPRSSRLDARKDSRHCNFIFNFF